MNGVVAAALQLITNRSLAGAGKPFDQIIPPAHVLEIRISGRDALNSERSEPRHLRRYVRFKFRADGGALTGNLGAAPRGFLFADLRGSAAFTDRNVTMQRVRVLAGTRRAGNALNDETDTEGATFGVGRQRTMRTRRATALRPGKPPIIESDRRRNGAIAKADNQSALWLAG